MTEFLSTLEASWRVRESQDCIRRAIRDGELPAKKVTDRYLIAVADLDQWAERRAGAVGNGE
jgi:excisionase family DNA binding protein